MTRKKAFSLVEILIVVTILGIMAGYVTLSAKSTGQTAKAEAEKVAQLFRRYITKADKFHGGYYFLIDSDKITVKNNKGQSTIAKKELEKKPPDKASAGCTYIPKPEDEDIAYILDKISWRKGKNVRQITTRNVDILLKATEDNYPYSIKVTGKGDPYWVVLSYDNSL